MSHVLHAGWLVMFGVIPTGFIRMMNYIIHHAEGFDTAQMAMEFAVKWLSSPDMLMLDQ